MSPHPLLRRYSYAAEHRWSVPAPDGGIEGTSELVRDAGTSRESDDQIIPVELEVGLDAGHHVAIHSDLPLSRREVEATARHYEAAYWEDHPYGECGYYETCACCLDETPCRGEIECLIEVWNLGRPVDHLSMLADIAALGYAYFAGGRWLLTSSGRALVSQPYHFCDACGWWGDADPTQPLVGCCRSCGRRVRLTHCPDAREEVVYERA